MQSYKYLIVGGGMTGDAAVQGIRKVDADGSIGLFSLEADPPYNRPPLSKKLWTGKPLSSVWLKTPGPGVDIILETGVQSIDPQNKQVTDDHGNVYAYEKLLLATGGTPNRLPFGEDHILYFRTLADYRRLQKFNPEQRALCGHRRRFYRF